MKVLVTGASGFVGTHVTRQLLSAGHRVAALVLPGDPLLRLRDVLGDIDLLHGDLDHVRAHHDWLAGWAPEGCVHLAWYAEPGRYLEARENLTSLSGSLGLLDLLLSVGCGQFVVAGTCAECAESDAPLTEDAPTSPMTLYAASKLSLSLLARHLIPAGSASLAWARLFYLYGPGEDERRLIPAVIRALLGGERFAATRGDQVRDYLHVADVARALCLLLEGRANGTFNVASGIPISVREVLLAVERAVGRTQSIDFGAVPYRAWEPRFVCGDNRRLREATGWAPAFRTLEEGLAETVAWWRRAGEPSAGGGRR